MKLYPLSVLLTLSSVFACGEVSTLGTGMDSGGSASRGAEEEEEKDSASAEGSGGSAGSAGSAGKASGTGSASAGLGGAPSQGGTGMGGSSSVPTSGAGGMEEDPHPFCKNGVETNQGKSPPSEDECSAIGAELKAAHDSALQGAELTVSLLAGTWVAGSGPERIELALDSQGNGTLLFGEPTDLPEISDPNEAYLTNRAADDAYDMFGLVHLKPHRGFPYTIVAESGQGSEMSFHILVMETWETWCGMQTPVASPNARACYACLFDDGLYSFVDGKTSCDAPKGCYAGETFEDEQRVHCGRLELCVLPHYNVCSCTSEECFANLGGEAGQLTLYPYDISLDPLDPTILRLKPLSELEDKTTRYLEKQ